MTTSQLRKINVIIQKKMASTDELRILTSLLLMPSTNLNQLCIAYYGARPEGEENSLQRRYMKGYLKKLMLKLDYWGLPFIITVAKDETVNLTMKEGTDG